MKKLNVVNVKGEKVSDITLNEKVWGIEPNDAVIYDAVRLARNAERQGTADTKTRSEVSGGGAKPWRQKGTGRARQGSTRAPHWYHGGVVFGPHPDRNYTTKQNRKERRLALKSTLSYKVIESELIIVDDIKLTSNKAKEFKDLMTDLKLDKNILIVVNELDENLILASRNFRNVIVLAADEINVLDIISADKMVVTKDAVKAIEEVLNYE
ncbi:MAG: 50S ribosomal protein L4 [Bacilli bacterium]|nr:50S ribosomal protein L4 [Bacilli bacterium]